MPISSRRHGSYDDEIVVVGAGIFGLTTAIELRSRGYKRITVMDRMMPPVPDGSSVDVSRIIRYDYSDPFYAQMAREALQEWRKMPFQPFYHNTGFVLASEAAHDPFLEKLKGVLRNQGQPFNEFRSSSELRRMFPDLAGIEQDFGGYVNPNGGWADAAGTIRSLAALCGERGVSIITGPRGTVLSLKISKGQIVGLNVASGPPVLCSKVILATGAWTNRFLDLTHAISSSAQPVGFIQLTPEEARKLSKMPVLINMDSGFFIFPPTPDTHILKVARHSHGFETKIEVEGTDRVISSPKRDSNNAASSYLPEDADSALRQGLRQIVPEVAGLPWMRRRLCWYTDTPKGDFVVDHHPSIEGLFIATGGAGHGFKFAPILGRYIADCYENKASEEIRRRWRLQKSDDQRSPMVCNDGSRRGPERRLLSVQEQAKL